MQAFFSGTVRVWNELYAADAELEGIISRRDSRWQHVGRLCAAASLQQIFAEGILACKPWHSLSV